MSENTVGVTEAHWEPRRLVVGNESTLSTCRSLKGRFDEVGRPKASWKSPFERWWLCLSTDGASDGWEWRARP
ncbi:hypothetical protein KC365_g28 [Hortaea werneckii]|nr:hypothetical protein KC339_g25 [Hortaea werneckii]KAI7245806.1 hypothetical protein KC365_g28 [Hortaea werneckii]